MPKKGDHLKLVHSKPISKRIKGSLSKAASVLTGKERSEAVRAEFLEKASAACSEGMKKVDAKLTAMFKSGLMEADKKEELLARCGAALQIMETLENAMDNVRENEDTAMARAGVGTAAEADAFVRALFEAGDGKAEESYFRLRRELGKIGGKMDAAIGGSGHMELAEDRFSVITTVDMVNYAMGLEVPVEQMDLLMVAVSDANEIRNKRFRHEALSLISEKSVELVEGLIGDVKGVGMMDQLVPQFQLMWHVEKAVLDGPDKERLLRELKEITE